MTEQLKPCPFCGREQMTDEERGDVFAYRGQRRSCDFCGVITVDWNTRPLETALRARIPELEALLSKQAESDNKHIAELEAENAALKAENAQHDWWGGGGR